MTNHTSSTPAFKPELDPTVKQTGAPLTGNQRRPAKIHELACKAQFTVRSQSSNYRGGARYAGAKPAGYSVLSFRLRVQFYSYEPSH